MLVPRLPPRTLMILGVLYFTFFGGSVYTESDFWPRVVHQVIVTALLGLWLFALWRSGRGFPATPLDLPLAAYVVALLVAGLGARFPRVSLEQSWTPLVHLLGFYLLVDLMRRGWGRWIVEGLFLAGAVVVILSGVELASWYIGLPLSPDFDMGWLEVGAGPIPPFLHEVQLALSNANIQGTYLALLLPTATTWALTAHRRDYRQGGLLLAGGLLAALLLTQSRGAVLAAGSSTGVLAGFWLWRRLAPQRRRGFWAFGLVAAGGVAVLLFGVFALPRLADPGRQELWRVAVEIVRERPITGIGHAMYGSTLRLYRVADIEANIERLIAAHNLYLHVAAELGVAGLAVLAGLAITFVVAWVRQWQAAGETRRRRLEACLAAMIGFGVHGLVDTFSLTPVILPLLIYAAYTAGGQPAPARASSAPGKPRRWPLVLAGALLAGYAAAFVPIDAAMYNLMQSKQHFAADELPAALEAGERAAALDPALDLYAAHIAYLLGRLANEEPDVYLDRAIAAHQAALQIRPDFDVGYANLGALYAQRGDMDAASEALERAAVILPTNALFWLKLGEYREAAGDVEGALDAYVTALERQPMLSYSAFWTEPGEHPARVQAFDAAIREARPKQALAIALATDDLNAARDLLAAHPELYDESLVDVGRYFHAVGDDGEAIRWLNRTTAQLPARLPFVQWWIPYLYLSEIYAAQSDWPAAEHHARMALFFQPGEARWANYILAQVAMNAGNWEDAERYLARAAAGRSVIQYFAIANYGTIFGRLASFDYLPQLRIPGPGARAFEPWLVLADRYLATGRADRAAYIYTLIAQIDPYLASDMAERLAALNP